ncbi:MAG: hypothetical protein IT431_03490 [Phycisphaerales bacterium]|nr:hypothetical protein [Phycisphaerales bacterium]
MYDLVDRDGSFAPFGDSAVGMAGSPGSLRRAWAGFGRPGLGTDMPTGAEVARDVVKFQRAWSVCGVGMVER